MDMPRIFIGYDKNERVAAYVLAHSLQRQASGPISITFLNKATLPWFRRKRGDLDSTDFSISRFLVPSICDFKGFALFLDCDMVCLGNIYDLWDLKHTDYTVQVVTHDKYVPTEEIKFLGNIQTKYAKKNWSSVMLFNNAECKALTPAFVETAHGLYLHGFNWIGLLGQIGSLPPEWNILVGQQEIPDNPKLLHYTLGGPYFEEFKKCQCAEIWLEEFRDMVYANTANLKYLL